MNRLEVIRKTITCLGVDHGIPSLLTHEISRSALSELMDCMTYIVFPEFSNPPMQRVPDHLRQLGGCALLQWTLSNIADIITSQLYCAFLCHGSTECLGNGVENQQEIPSNNDEPLEIRAKKKAESITEIFLTNDLQIIRQLLRSDAEALLEGDVVSTTLSEIVLCYPGILCMKHQRTAHALYKRGAPNNLTRLLTEMAHSITGIDIHPGTSVGHHFFIDHGTGIVIGGTSIIGNYVSIYQGVTLGAKSFPVDKKTGKKIRNLPRHPIIEDNVTIYANTVVLGSIRIGKGSTIGGNCWVVQDLPPGSVIAQKPHAKYSSLALLFHSDGSGI